MEIKNLNLQKQIDELKLLQDNWLDKVFPIGSIYKSVDSTSPEELFGGAWMSWGQGKVPVGIDPNDTDFNTVEKTGGEKIHTLTVNELPSHTHMLHLVSTQLGDGGGMWGTTYSQYDGNVDTYSTGNSQPHNNLQPYETLYMWKRVEPVFIIEYVDKNGEHSESFSPDYEKSDCGLKDYISSVLDSIELTFPEKISLLKVSSFGIDLKSCNNIFSGTDNFSRNINNVIKIDVSDLNTRNTTDMSYMFSTVLYASPNLEEIILTNLNTKNVKNMQGMFQNKKGLTTLDLSNFNTSSVTDMSSMFYYCATLNSVNLSNFNTDNVTDMSNMFYRCDNLTSLDLSKFNTSNVTDMRYMFFNCSSLTSLDLSSFDTSKASNLSYMFYGFKGSKLDLSNFILKQGVDISGMFSTCENLQELDLSNFDFTKVGKINKFVFADVPTNCLIYVKDQVAKNFVLSIRSDLTNIQIKS